MIFVANLYYAFLLKHIFVLYSTAITSDDEFVNPPKRLRKKRKKKEDEQVEDIIDGFSIKSFKTYPLLLQSKQNDHEVALDDTVTSRKEESTETSSANAHEESYVSYQ